MTPGAVQRPTANGPLWFPTIDGQHVPACLGHRSPDEATRAAEAYHAKMTAKLARTLDD